MIKPSQPKTPNRTRTDIINIDKGMSVQDLLNAINTLQTQNNITVSLNDAKFDSQDHESIWVTITTRLSDAELAALQDKHQKRYQKELKDYKDFITQEYNTLNP